jgi:Protein of unknown function (DUF4242)
VGTYLVERFLPGVPGDELGRIGERSRTACRRLAAQGVQVRYLGSTLVPRDESCFCLFEANSQAEVERANQESGLSYVRISEAVATGERLIRAT